MPYIFKLALGFLVWAAAPLIGRILLSLGVGVVSFIGFGFVIDFMFNQITASISTLPAAVLQLAALMKLDVAINIIFGAVNARFANISLNGIVTRFQIDPAAYQGS